MSMSRPPAKRSGRRSGTTHTREQIAVAARAQFAELGYERATFRGIAAAAGVDPALVVHFYGSKDDLFREVMQLPPAVSDALGAIAGGPRDQMGHRLAEVVIGHRGAHVYPADPLGIRASHARLTASRPRAGPGPTWPRPRA